MYVAFILVLISCTFVALNFLTPSLVPETGDYRMGNRLRYLAVLKLELMMLPFSLLIYEKASSCYNIYLAEKSRNRSLFKSNYSGIVMSLVVIWLFLSHLAYVLFYLPEPLSLILCYPSNMSAGLWNYFAPILFGVYLCSIVVPFFKITSQFVQSNWFLWRLLNDDRFLFKIVLGISITLSVATHLSSKHIFVKEITIAMKDLPKEAVGLRFALISDLHAGSCVTRNEIAQVVEVVNAQHVDGVFIVGDAVDGERNDTFDRLGPLQFLRSSFGTFYVSGNHEYYYGNAMEWFKQFRDYGLQVLDNQNVHLNGICLVGINDYSSNRSGIKGHRFDPDAALKGCQMDRPVIVLTHNPAATQDIVHNAEHMRVDLILSGHTHAGQFYTMVPLVYFFLPYFHGLYTVGSQTRLLVSAGTLYQGPPMKMIGLTEVWIIELQADL